MAIPDEVQKICKKINKQYGEDTLIYENQTERLDIDFIPTGLINLDLATKPDKGKGGIPRGRLVEIYGPEGGGKSALCLSIVAEAQKNNMMCAFMDAENSYNPFFAKNIMGVNNSKLALSRAQAGEKVLNAIEAMIVTNEFDLIVLDSVASLPSQRVLKDDMEQDHVAPEARMWSQALKKIKGKMSRYNTTLLYTNQLREDPGKMYGNPEITPAGRALKFYSDMRIEVKRREFFQESDGDTRVDKGHKIRCRIKKNKIGKPGGYALVDIWYGVGYDKKKALLNAAKKSDTIERAGSWYTFEPSLEDVDIIKKQGFDNLVTAIKEHERSDELMDNLRNQILGGDSVESKSEKDGESD